MKGNMAGNKNGMARIYNNQIIVCRSLSLWHKNYFFRKVNKYRIPAQKRRLSKHKHRNVFFHLIF